MQLQSLDYILIALFFLLSLLIGLFAARKAGKNTEEFFLSGRKMPWWLLGISMVATTFAADTPNLVTEIVRTRGVSGNWLWWAFLLTGMLTVFFYARLWRRSEVLTDLGFYELRYSGREAQFLRGFRAIYLGVLFNIIVMATVCVAAIKMGEVLLGLEAWQTLTLTALVIVPYSTLGGLRGVLLTDLFQFVIAMIGSVGAAIVILNLPEVGGLEALISHPNVSGKLNFFPDFSDKESLITLLILPLAVQWWSVWYPGAEPGGGGYIAQRMLSAKSENHALGATLFFNIAHYALRPWPWILIALASLVVFPDLSQLQTQLSLSKNLLKDDIAYPAMLTFLPSGLLGIVIASLGAAFMSTISTHLNWGASYVTQDVYRRFVNPESSEKNLVWVGRVTTVITMVLAMALALFLESALDGFQIILKIGAGTGLIFVLRWFWWRINAYSEISGMIISFLVAIFFEVFEGIKVGDYQLLLEVGMTTAGWLSVTFATRPTDEKTLRSFFKKIQPHAFGWQSVLRKYPDIQTSPSLNSSPAQQLLGMVLAVSLVYGLLFGTGCLLYGQTLTAFVLIVMSLLCGLGIWRVLR